VVVGIVGNVLLDPDGVRLFGVYFAVALGIVGVMFMRLHLMRAAMYVSRSMVERIQSMNEWVRKTVLRKMEEINSREIVYFAKGADPAELNRAALYVLENEQTSNMKVVFAYEDEREIPNQLAERLSQIDKLYPQLRIDFLAVKGKFGPELIELLSRHLDIPKNYMFIGTPGDRFPHRIEELGGVRLIL